MAIYFLGICALVATVASQDAKLVQTANGPVKGYKDPDSGVYQFLGVPYATAPTGRDKFRPPLPAPAWLQPLEAVDKTIVCPQLEFFPVYTDLKKQENCLIANIYVPDTDKTNLPVVVYVHGGAYQFGHAALTNPTRMVKSKKIIAVTFNYRLGVHGFLCLGTKSVPGNAGMKDQVALLRWVKRNIAKFGGNPDDVTISGYSAGSSSVDLLMISKTIKGLFNKVIPESGANVAVWSVQQDPFENAKKLALKLNFTNVDDINALEEFYTTASYDVLQSFHFFDLTDSTFFAVPCVERDLGEERFLHDAPVNILKKGDYQKLPMLYGFANMEGLFRVQFFHKEFVQGMRADFSKYLPADLKFDNDDERKDIAKRVKQFYFGDSDIGEETILAYIDYYTDILFAYPTLRSVKLQLAAGNDKIYLYEYAYPQEFVTEEGTKILGANHCAQTPAIIDLMLPDYMNKTYDEHYENFRNTMLEMWQNFIITGSPVPSGSRLPSWPPVSAADCTPHMVLNSNFELKGPLLEERTRFWEKIYEEHYLTPIPPPRPPHSEL